MVTLESLQAKIKRLEQQAEALLAKQSSGVIEKIRGLMEKHGLTTADINAHAGGKQRAKNAEAKTVIAPAATCMVTARKSLSEACLLARTNFRRNWRPSFCPRRLGTLRTRF
jgi:hypothetical protein